MDENGWDEAIDLETRIRFAAIRLRRAIRLEGVSRVFGSSVDHADARTSSQDAATALLLLVHEQYQLEV